MNYFLEPSFNPEETPPIAVYRLNGDWTRVLPEDIKRATDLKIRSLNPQYPVVLDVTNVRLMDSFGESLVCDLVQHVLDANRRIALLCDENETARYAGLEASFNDRGLKVPIFGTLELARENLLEQP